MKKLLFSLVAVLLVTAGCSSDDAAAPKEEKQKEEVKKEEAKKEKPKEDKKKENNKTTIELNEKMVFAELTINMKKVKVYEEEGKHLAEVNFSWTNQSGDGKKYFFALMTESAKQGDESLEEVSGAYDMANKKTNSMHEHNPEGGTVNIKLIYELKDKTTPLEITFSPLNEFNEEKQVLSIDLD